jgi:hypothetical protein
LLASWDRMGKGLSDQQKRQLSISAGKAWRFEGEMDEIAATFAAVDLPDGIHVAAAELYHRLSSFKDTTDTELEDILHALLERPG